MRSYVDSFETLDPASQRILDLLDKIQANARKAGISVTSFTQDGVETLKTLDANRKAGIESQLASAVEILNLAGIGDDEVLSVTKALWKYSLYSKEDLTQYIDEGDVVEIYNGEARQIYRNFEFVRLCSYSLLEIMIHEWFVLHERPQAATDALMETAHSVMTTGQMRSFSVPKHIMRERHKEAKQVFSAEFKHFIPLFHTQGGQPAAFLLTLKALPIIEHSDGVNVHMLERTAN